MKKYLLANALIAISSTVFSFHEMENVEVSEPTNNTKIFRVLPVERSQYKLDYLAKKLGNYVRNNLLHYCKKIASIISNETYTSDITLYENNDNVNYDKVISKSGVEIDNTGEEPVLHFKDKSVFLTTALLNYFQVPEDYIDNAHAYCEFHFFMKTNPSPEEACKYYVQHLEKKFNRLNNPFLPDELFKILNESETVRIETLLPETIEKDSKNKTIQSIIMFSFKNKDGVFRCSIHLKNDISALFS